MALTTFGAIMGFAAEIAGKGEEIYKVLGAEGQRSNPQGSLQALSEEEGRVITS